VIYLDIVKSVLHCDLNRQLNLLIMKKTFIEKVGNYTKKSKKGMKG